MAREEIAKAVSLALIANGIGSTTDEMHSWRCNYPERYGPCRCLAEAVTDVVEAVMREVASMLTDSWDQGYAAAMDAAMSPFDPAHRGNGTAQAYQVVDALRKRAVEVVNARATPEVS